MYFFLILDLDFILSFCKCLLRWSFDKGMEQDWYAAAFRSPSPVPPPIFPTSSLLRSRGCGESGMRGKENEPHLFWPAVFRPSSFPTYSLHTSALSSCSSIIFFYQSFPLWGPFVVVFFFCPILFYLFISLHFLLMVDTMFFCSSLWFSFIFSVLPSRSMGADLHTFVCLRVWTPWRASQYQSLLSFLRYNILFLIFQ